MTWGSVGVALLSLLLELPRYDRAAWPHWTGGCLDVREQVLIAESRRPVVLDTSGCRILSGEWLDEYTGELITAPGALDVDHMIPLANAHRAGGWRWTRTQRQTYANDTSYPEHLIAVSAAANRAKGDKGPDRWLPPRVAAWCAYGQAWRTVATRYHLTLTTAEQAAIRKVLATCLPVAAGGTP